MFRILKQLSAALLILLASAINVDAGLVFSESQEVDLSSVATKNLLGQKLHRFREAEELFAKGEHKACAQLLMQFKQENSSLPPVELMLVWFLMSDGRLQDAKAALEQVAARYPNHPQTCLTQGQIALAERRFADAAISIEKAVTVKLPADWDVDHQRRFATMALDALSSVYEQQQRWSDAQRTVEAVLNLEKTSKRQLRLANIFYHLQLEGRAREILDEVSASDRSLPPVPLQLAQIAYRAGDYEKVDAFISEASQAASDDPRILLWRAEWALINRDFEQANQLLPALNLTLKADAERVAGLVAVGQGHFRDALEHLQNAQELTRDRALSSVLRRQELMVEAYSAVQEKSISLSSILERVEVIALEPDADGATVSLLGWLYHLNQRPVEARLMLARGFQMSGHASPDQAFAMADFLSSSEDPVERQRGREMLRELQSSKGNFFLLQPLVEARLAELSPK